MKNKYELTMEEHANKFKLDKDEIETLEALEKKYPNGFKKKARVSFRLSEKDLAIFKIKAQQKGFPYQTFLAAIIHQYNTGRLKEVDK